MSDNIIKLADNFYARCPNCGSWDFKIRLNGPGDTWTRILGTECSNEECSFLIDWVAVNTKITKSNDGGETY